MAKKRTHPLIEGLFSLEGRMRRSEYWMISIGLGVVKIPLAFMSNLLGPELSAIARGLLELLFLWPSVALMVKRGHDRNRSALYTAAILGALLVAGVASVSFATGVASYVTAALIVLILVYVFIDYGCLDGTQGSNRYGRSPKGIGGGPDDKLAEVFA